MQADFVAVQRNSSYSQELKLTVPMIDERGKRWICPIDVYSLISLPLLQSRKAIDCEVEFPGRKRSLMIDILLSSFLSKLPLERVFNEMGVVRYPEEFAFALFYDKTPNLIEVLQVFLSFWGEIRMPEDSYCGESVKVVGLVLVKGRETFAVTAGSKRGMVLVSEPEFEQEMGLEDLGKMVVEWEMRIDLVFFAGNSDGFLGHLDDNQDLVTSFRTAIDEMNGIQLMVELPFIRHERGNSSVEMGERREEHMKMCQECGKEARNNLCDDCSKQRYFEMTKTVRASTILKAPNQSSANPPRKSFPPPDSDQLPLLRGSPFTISPTIPPFSTSSSDFSPQIDSLQSESDEVQVQIRNEGEDTWDCRICGKMKIRSRGNICPGCNKPRINVKEICETVKESHVIPRPFTQKRSATSERVNPSKGKLNEKIALKPPNFPAQKYLTKYMKK